MKDILVHIDDSERCAARLDIAIGLAKSFGARLTGLFARTESHRPSAVAHKASDQLTQARDAAKGKFTAACAAAGITSRWWQLAHGEPGHVVSETMFCARYADLVVMGQSEPKSKLVPEEMVEHVILHCGRPVLVVPHTGSFPSVGERIALAWNAGKEAVRALNDAKPLMAAAKSVTVLSLRGPSDEASSGMGEVPQVDIIDHLAACGITANAERLAGEHIGKMDMLLSRLCDLGADLVVMGAHGHYGLSLKRGTGTRYVLAHMTVPVLMSN
ncbi:universal stress protein UspA-like nucleotide-binding protein [Paramagnetospirillum caucaseum]|uniref:Universal stress protein UspA-like nucleotide-binding protein n=1 Tax=Paramagnetospirillum caucaseum TaxID=1244869 RepID=M2Y7C7_9PROT|nr:universal stress protein [Paramagnetospirillum caucaseum]EME68961.1 universal stress protein UspA-like nucleotide-binding protein [Paramagnetospirillum caucaseum]